MKGKLDEALIFKELETIFKSPQFVNSEKEKILLEYLVRKTITKEFIKEVHIAIDVFKKEGDFDPSVDSTVRVYMGKLRKKLENFYLTETSKYLNIKFTIPKGHYIVEFDKRIRKRKLGQSKYFLLFVVLFVFILIIISVLHFINDKNDLYNKTKLVSESAVWKEYLNSDLPTMIVVGDFYFMRKRIGNDRYIVRNAVINSTEEFKLNQLDTLGFEEYRYTYAPSEMSECVSSLIPHLLNNKAIFKIKKASLLTWEDVNSNNIIFVGDFKTLYILKKILPQFNIKYDLSGRTYFLLDENKKIINKFDFNRNNEGYRNENIVVSKRAGGNNNTITLIMALGRGGIDDVTRKLCNREFLDNFIKTYEKAKINTPFYFDLVFEIEGIEETSLKSEIVYFNRINP